MDILHLHTYFLCFCNFFFSFYFSCFALISRNSLISFVFNLGFLFLAGGGPFRRSLFFLSQNSTWESIWHSTLNVKYASIWFEWIDQTRYVIETGKKHIPNKRRDFEIVLAFNLIQKLYGNVTYSVTRPELSLWSELMLHMLDIIILCYVVIKPMHWKQIQKQKAKVKRRLATNKSHLFIFMWRNIFNGHKTLSPRN